MNTKIRKSFYKSRKVLMMEKATQCGCKILECNNDSSIIRLSWWGTAPHIIPEMRESGEQILQNKEGKNSGL
jgi:hypothetical protein